MDTVGNLTLPPWDVKNCAVSDVRDTAPGTLCPASATIGTMPEPPASHAAQPRRIFLVRHGTAEGAEGVAVGHVDLPLSAEGAASIERLAKTWPGPPPDLLLSSDLARAADSADLLATAWDIEVSGRDPRLREMDFGHWDGLSFGDIRRRDAGLFDHWKDRWWRQPAPGGESMVDVARRARGWLEEQLQEGPETVVAVAHGGSIRTLLAHLLGMDGEKVFKLHLDHGRVSGLGTGLHGLEVHLVNSPDFFPIETARPFQL